MLDLVRQPFTKAVIRVVPAVVSSLRIVAGLQLLLSFLANSELVYEPSARRCERVTVVTVSVCCVTFRFWIRSRFQG